MQSKHINLSIASPTEIEYTAHLLTAVRDGFLSSTGEFLSYTPRPLILQSWERCRALHVNPSRRCAPLAVAREEQLEQKREENAWLVAAAHVTIERLNDFLMGSGYVVVLSDAQGCLLDVIGDVSIRRRLARIDFVPGGNWHEAAAGTNAIGTALTDGHTVQLMAAEHYCDGWQDLTCTATPIRHPCTNEIIGILDVTGNYHLIRPFLTSLLAAAALEISQRFTTFLLPSPCCARDLTYRQRLSSTLLMPDYHSEMNMSEAFSPKQKKRMLAADTFDVEVQSLLRHQARRAYDAERLTTAASIISASLDMQVTLENVAEQAAHLLRVEGTGVYLFNQQYEIMSAYVWPQLAPQGVERVMIELLQDATAVALVCERGEPVIINDVLLSTQVPASWHKRTGIRSLLLIPLVTARGVSGFLTFSGPVPYQWPIEQINLGLTFAMQSATVIENARLFAALQQHTAHIETLNAIAQTLSTLPDPAQHLDLVLQQLSQIIHVDAGLILLLDQSTQQFLLAAQYGIPDQLELDLKQFPLRPLLMLAQRVVEMREPMLHCTEADDYELIHRHEHDALRQLEFAHLVVVPLTTSNTTLGVLLLGNRQAEHSIGGDRQFFSTVGQQFGLALRNAQLLRSESEMVALREADRLKNGFLAAVSHDLRSPITAIHASVESLLDVDGIQSAMGTEHLLRNIAGQATRLAHLVDQLLDLSRIEAGALALDCDWTELSTLIVDAITEFERLHTGYHIELITDENIPLYFIDPDRLMQVFWNLLDNAYKYAVPSLPLRVGVSLLAKEVLISVADRGPGIPACEQERVFQRFYRLGRDQKVYTKGSGLGLAICRGFVEAHGGHIWVEDNPGGGCIFCISLPLPTSNPSGGENLEEPELLV